MRQCESQGEVHLLTDDDLMTALDAVGDGLKWAYEYGDAGGFRLFTVGPNDETAYEGRGYKLYADVRELLVEVAELGDL